MTVPESGPRPSGPPQTHTAPRTPTALGGRILATLSRMDGTATGLTETRDRILAELDALETRAEQAEAAVQRVRDLAEDMRTWCSPYRMAPAYADRIITALNPKETP